MADREAGQCLFLLFISFAYCCSGDKDIERVADNNETCQNKYPSCNNHHRS